MLVFIPSVEVLGILCLFFLFFVFIMEEEGEFAGKRIRDQVVNTHPRTATHTLHPYRAFLFLPPDE